jgi:hypothetical protein
MSSDKLKYVYNRFMGVENGQKMSKTGLKKSGRFVIFLGQIWSILSEKWAIRIYRKTGPTKSTVLGPRPPPWENVEIYRFLPNFHVFGAFNRAGKSVSKIGIYALPPLKSDFYTISYKFATQFHTYTILLIRDPIYFPQVTNF